MQSAMLVNNGSNTMCFDNGPDEERDARDWNNDGLDGEEMATEWVCQ